MKIETESLTKIYFRGKPNQVSAVMNVSIEIKYGDFMIVKGPSGSGKTTLLNLIGLLTKPTKGRIFYDGEEVSSYSDAWQTRIRREKVGFIFQQYNLLPQFSAWENVALPLICRSFSKIERRRVAVETMKRLGLEKRIEFKVAHLSGGEQQRVAISRALITDPQLILADEPTASVDAETSTRILEMLKQAKREKKTVIASTHDPAIFKQGNSIIELQEGVLTKRDR